MGVRNGSNNHEITVVAIEERRKRRTISKWVSGGVRRGRRVG